MLAVAVGVQSSVIAGLPGLGLGPLGLGVHGLGVHGLGVHGLGVHGLGLGVHGLGLGVPGIGLSHGLLGAPAAINIAGLSHGIPAAHIPAAVNIATGHLGISHAAQATLAGPHGATYVAKTRGAVHTAPLAGHIQSAASINVAPAPGTW